MNILSLKNQWLPVTRLKKISTRPKRFIILDHPVVIFRLNKQIIALEDRCPHRGAPLSAGKIRNGLLQCAYHGWQFNGSGQCMHIPGLTSSTDFAFKCVPSYALQTDRHLLYICLAPDQLTHPLPTIRQTKNSIYGEFTVDFILKGELLNILENVLDTTHTHFIHGRLLRLDKKRHRVKASLTANPQSVEVRYENEPTPAGWVSRLFEDKRTVSIGRFSLPLQVQLEYHTATGLLALFTFHLSPIHTDTHRIFLCAHYKSKPLFRWIKMLFIRPFLKCAFIQDKIILKKQHNNSLYFKNSAFKSTELDMVRPHLERLLKGEASSVPFQKTIWLDV